jgi:hypothetical protein
MAMSGCRTLSVASASVTDGCCGPADEHLACDLRPLLDAIRVDVPSRERGNVQRPADRRLSGVAHRCPRALPILAVIVNNSRPNKSLSYPGSCQARAPGA